MNKTPAIQTIKEEKKYARSHDKYDSLKHKTTLYNKNFDGKKIREQNHINFSKTTKIQEKLFQISFAIFEEKYIIPI